VSAATAFLNPVKGRANLTIHTSVHATEIILEGRRAIGVRLRRGGRHGPAAEGRARRGGSLSGGTYNSAQLLQLSGTAPASLLQSLGITVRHALSGVGERLQDHYAPRTVARVKGITTLNERARGLSLVAEVARWAVTRRGFLAQSPTLVYCFWHSGESA